MLTNPKKIAKFEEFFPTYVHIPPTVRRKIISPESCCEISAHPDVGEVRRDARRHQDAGL